ncbi:MAG: NTP transferase domain-containing protein, partial [Bacillota bacterium]|nr:NTP transferase domain-containing protein [Bacillota bacterium]
MDNQNTALVILAGGFSSRMQDFKPLLPVGGLSAVSLCLKLAKAAGIDRVLVVTGHRHEELEGHLAGKGETIYNPQFAEGMFTSIQAGLAALQKTGPFPEAVLLLPVDHPLVPAAAVEQLLEAHRAHPDSFIVPCFHGKKGHPLLIPRRFFREIAEYEGTKGLKGVTDAHPEELLRIDTPWEGVVLDMDSPEDYRELLEYYQKNRIPGKDVCLAALEEYGTPPHVMRHCTAVAETAVKMAAALNRAGYEFDLPRLRAACLLHDIARVEEDHGEAGARYAEKQGWYELAPLIRPHMYYSKE